jgi:hypothetical protein
MTTAAKNSSTPPVVPNIGQKLPSRYFARRAFACRMMFSIRACPVQSAGDCRRLSRAWLSLPLSGQPRMQQS